MKICVLDTNVLLDRELESVLHSFEEPTKVILPLPVLEELDTFKKGFEIKNVHARAANKFLDGLREKGKLHEGVTYGDHIIQVSINMDDLDLDKPDYKIIKTAKENKGVLISQDINERVIADAVGVESSHFAPNDVNVNELYTGYINIDIDDNQVQEFYRTGFLAMNTVEKDGETYPLLNNQFVIMHDELGGTHEGIYKAANGGVSNLERNYETWGIRPKKDKKGHTVAEQKYLMHLLLDPDIEFVTAIGPSGCGKTLLTLAAALEQTLKDTQYNKVTVMRPLVAVGNDIGFLPGDKLEKLEPWMASTFDALDVLLENYDVKDGYGFGGKEKVYSLIQQGDLELEAMAHIRGRSLPKQFLIIDDAQNLTQHEAASIITRAGEGTKVVFLGDLSEKQIDNHRLTPSSNGLAYVIDNLKGEDIVGHITLNTVVRSRLAQLGVEKL
ncbi:PhoH family protein [Bacillus stercoris]|nr:PhoH family protein [Bacillus stercoris]